MVFTVLAPDSEPKITDAIPFDIKHAICDVFTGYSHHHGVFFDVKRTDGTTCRYLRLQHMLWTFDRNDVCSLWYVYKEKYGDTKFKTPKKNGPAEIHDFLMWQSLKIMFNPSMEDSIWKDIAGYKLRRWMLYQSCGVHILDIGVYTVYFLTEKDYPGLNMHKDILKQMFERNDTLKLQRHFMSDHQAYKLLQKYEKILDPSKRRRFQKK